MTLRGKWGTTAAVGILSCTVCFPATIMVDPTGRGNFIDIQAALDAAADGDTVVVKPGEYVIDQPINFNRLHNPFIPASPPLKNIIVRCEWGRGTVTIRMSDTPLYEDWASVVIFDSGETSSSVLDGFRLTGGKGTKFGTGSQETGGGGLLCRKGSSPSIVGCTITGNIAEFGGGVYCQKNAAPTFTNCTISRNTARRSGGGMYLRDRALPILFNCTVSGNAAEIGGGLCSADGTSFPTLTSCIVWENPGGSVSGPAFVTYSCTQGDSPWIGMGNINSDPLFRGWKDRGEVWVNLSRAGPGSGTQADPYADLSQAISGYSLALCRGSPCIGAGKAGLNMGSEPGIPDPPGAKARLVHLCSGTYNVGLLSLSQGLSLQGVGEWSTVIQGTVMGLGTGCSLSYLTVMGGAWRGIVVSTGEKPYIHDCTISENAGCGVYCLSDASFKNCTITGNRGDEGGGVYCGWGSAPTLTNCSISWNDATEGGGGVFCVGSKATLKECSILWNSTPKWGGGLFSISSSPSLEGCRIAANAALDVGGGVFCMISSPTFTECTIWGNAGGGLYCGADASPVLTNCRIACNVGEFGGGIHASGHCSPTLTNCTMYGNLAKKEGGALYCYLNSSPILRNCTISGNAAFGRGGILCIENSSPKLENCIVWRNYPDSICGSLSHCLSNRDPLFTRLGQYDFQRFDSVVVGDREYRLPDFLVEAPDFRLKPRSPAIDAGMLDGAPDVDIEGRERPCGGGVDIGAYESGSCSANLRFLRGDADGNGRIDLTDPVFLLKHLFQGSVMPRCMDAADADDNDTVNLTDAVYSLLFQFLSGAPPPPPFPMCGTEGAADSVTCEFYDQCP